ncbi:MAG: aldehyde dehydrogenase family protein, partial [Burkholderiales bacterium]
MNKPMEVKAETVPMWINGRREAAKSTRTGEVTNTATGTVVRTVPFCNAADVDTAVASAKAAFPGWRKTPSLRRARILMRYRELLEQHRDELAALITEEHGKTIVDATGSVQRGIEVVEFAMGIPHLMKGELSEEVGTDVDTHSLREPLGVCAGITPFNFPAMIPMWMFAPAIAAGNAFILKPSERAPSVPMMLAELMEEAGLPPGILQVVN